jgi:cytoskeletal protein RodZ
VSKLGSLLRSKREKLGLNIQDIAKTTAIRIQWLEMLEAGKFDEMPSYVHVHGFVSQYTKAVGLDFEAEVKPLLDEECPKGSFGQDEEALAQEAEKEAATAKSSRNLLIMASIAIILVLAIVGYMSTRQVKEDTATQTRPEPVPITELPVTYDPVVLIDQLNANGNSTVSSATDNVTIPETIVDNATEETPAPVTSFNALLTYTDACWTYLESDLGETADFSARAGDRRVIAFDKYFRMDVGNAAAVSVTVNGEDLNNFGNQGQVVRNVYISVDNGTVKVARTQPQ